MIALMHVEPTPNPNAFKFHTGTELLSEGLQLSFSNADDAERLPIARALFAMGEIEAVLIAEDFVSVSGTRGVNWREVKSLVEREIGGFNVAGAQALAAEMNLAAKEAKPQSDDPLFNQITELIDMYVKPALAGDGGAVDLVSVEDKIVTIRYHGACGSCPTSTGATLTAIENLLHDKIDPDLRLVSG